MRDGSIMATGYLTDAAKPRTELFTLRLTAAGESQELQTFANSHFGAGRTLALDAANRLWLCGSSRTRQGDADLWLLRSRDGDD